MGQPEVMAEMSLLTAGSCGRARSLSVLAQEELGKALWIYEDFSFSWNEGDDTARVENKLAQHGRDHTKKYLEAVVFGDELAEFWEITAAFANWAPTPIRGKKHTRDANEKPSLLLARQTTPNSGDSMSTGPRTDPCSHRPRSRPERQKRICRPQRR